MCEPAAYFGLRLLIGIPWPQHLRFLDSSVSRGEVRQGIRRAALALRDRDPGALAPGARLRRAIGSQAVADAAQAASDAP